MFQVLAEMSGSEEFLRLISFAEFVYLCEMTAASFPIGLWEVLEFNTAVATDIFVGKGIRSGELAVGIIGVIGEDGS